jgi:hypothetical protein
MRWFKQTKLHRWTAIHLGVLWGGASREWLSAHKAFEQPATADGKHLADLVALGIAKIALCVLVRHEPPSRAVLFQPESGN